MSRKASGRGRVLPDDCPAVVSRADRAFNVIARYTVIFVVVYFGAHIIVAAWRAAS